MIHPECISESKIISSAINRLRRRGLSQELLIEVVLLDIGKRSTFIYIPHQAITEYAAALDLLHFLLGYLRPSFRQLSDFHTLLHALGFTGLCHLCPPPFC